MLRGLEIRDMLIIERLDLGFRPGLNVLTGETGAGKSILLDSLGFVLGWRGRAELVRSGAERGEVTISLLSEDGRQGIRVVARDVGPGIEDLEQALRDVPAPVLRYALGAAHYRSTVEWSDQVVTEAAAAYRRIETFVRNASSMGGSNETVDAECTTTSKGSAISRSPVRSPSSTLVRASKIS